VIIVAALVPIVSGRAVVAGTDSRAHTRGVLLFVGDSNVVLASMQIVVTVSLLDHENDPYVPVLAARIGATIRSPDCRVVTGCPTDNYWQIKLKGMLSKIHPGAIVNNLGINDTTRVGTETTPGYSYYGRKINWFMQLIPATMPVYWTNLPCTIEPASLYTGCKAVNTALAAARSRWPNLVLVNWAALADSHPEYLVHLNGKPEVHNDPLGASAWIAQINKAIDARIPAN
jgi:hypothetical protein